MGSVIKKNKWHSKYPIPVWWIAMSPEYESCSGDWYEPPELTRDVLWVRTTSAHRAKILAIRAWRRGWSARWKRGKTITTYRPYIVDDSWINPMAEIKVVRPIIEMRDLIDYL